MSFSHDFFRTSLCALRTHIESRFCNPNVIILLSKHHHHHHHQGVLDRYRGSHSKEVIESDTSLIGHLIRSPYPTELERIADLTILILAGHDTTGYQLSWIIIEIIKVYHDFFYFFLPNIYLLTYFLSCISHNAFYSILMSLSS
jgi:hypothetical protein